MDCYYIPSINEFCKVSSCSFNFSVVARCCSNSFWIQDTAVHCMQHPYSVPDWWQLEAEGWGASAAGLHKERLKLSRYHEHYDRLAYTLEAGHEWIYTPSVSLSPPSNWPQCSKHVWNQCMKYACSDLCGRAYSERVHSIIKLLTKTFFGMLMMPYDLLQALFFSCISSNISCQMV